MVEHYRTAVGSITVTVLMDGQNEMDDERVKQIMANVPQDELDAVLKTVPRPILHSMNPFVIQSGAATVLVDTGLGTGAVPRGGRMLANMAAAGIAPEDVTRVFITHCHGDHINGLVTPDGDVVFVNADVAINPLEWDFWTDDATRQQRGADFEAHFDATFAPYREKLVMVGAGEAIAPGVTAVAAYGHTPGHTALMIESDGEQLFCLVDALHREIQLEHPDWSPVFDSQPDVSPVTRQSVLERAADDNLRVLFYHLAFPGLGFVRRQGDAFTWEPENP